MLSVLLMVVMLTPSAGDQFELRRIFPGRSGAHPPARRMLSSHAQQLVARFGQFFVPQTTLVNRRSKSKPVAVPGSMIAGRLNGTPGLL